MSELWQVLEFSKRFTLQDFWGNIKISVNGKTIIKDIRMFSVDLVKSYEFKVGEKEIHNIRIEKTALI